MSDAVRSTVKLTYDDLVAMFPDEDGVRRELIDGELFVTPSPIIRHQRVALRLSTALANHLAAHPDQGEVFAAPLDVVMTPHNVVEPDLFVVLGNQRDILTEKHVHGVPGIVIEVLSPGTRKRDLTIKRQLFDRQGVREYWIVDPDRNSVSVYRRGSDGALPLTTTLEAKDGNTLTTPLLRGWALPLESFFRS